MISYRKAVFKRAKQRLKEHGRTPSEIYRILFRMTADEEVVWQSKIHRASFHLVALNKMTMELDPVDKEVVWKLRDEGLRCQCLACRKEISLEASLGVTGDGWVSEWWADRKRGVVGDQELCGDCAAILLMSLENDRSCLRPEFYYDLEAHLICVKKSNSL